MIDRVDAFKLSIIRKNFIAGFLRSNSRVQYR
jgi:hypothetical protein